MERIQVTKRPAPLNRAVQTSSSACFAKTTCFRIEQRTVAFGLRAGSSTGFLQDRVRTAETPFGPGDPAWRRGETACGTNL